jgi:uncharacterized membrane protein YoaK (UPF0700 family)
VSEPSTPRPFLVWTLTALTVVSGIVDAVSYLGFGRVFTANMTGNVVVLGFAAAGAPGFTFLANLASLGAFLVGALVAGRIALHVKPRRSLLLVALALEATFTATAAVIAAAVPAIGVGWPRYTLIAVLAFAMGVRNSAVRRLGVPDMTTTVLTMTLTGLASDSSLAGGTNPNAGRRTVSVLSMFVGALVGAALLLHVGAAWPLGLAAGLVFVGAVFIRWKAPLDLGVAAK